MARSRALLVTLVVAAIIVAALAPVAVRRSLASESEVERFRGPLLTATEAVDEQIFAAVSVLDTLDAILAGRSADDPTLAPQLFAYLRDESQTWSESTRALDAAGLGHLDDDVAVRRQDLAELVTRLSEGFVNAGSAATIAAEADSATATVDTLREEYRDLRSRLQGDVLDPQLARIAESGENLHTILVVGLGSLFAFLLGAIVVVLRMSRRAASEANRIERERRRTETRTAFESSLMRGLEMAKTEDAVFGLVAQALSQGAPGFAGELLVADSSRAHFHRAVEVNGLGDGGCPVVSPLDCPAAARGQTATFADDIAIDTCPHLRGRGCSATCVPVSVAGKATGVVHLTGPLGAPPREDTLVAVEIVAHRSSERLAMVRAFEQTSAQANTDALTGLPNRRAVENRLRELQRGGQRYALAYADLDHFKQLNDLHGHETGDRALRLFARVLRETVRPTDLPARYGGEEFIVLLPDCGGDSADEILERVRAALTAAVANATVPPFTCSFGLAASEDGTLPEDVIAAADSALLEAKADGRDRVVRFGHPVNGLQLDGELSIVVAR